MMKKIIAAALALTLSLSMGNFAYAEEGSSSVPGSNSANIKATYQAGTETTGTVYSVDVAWGSLKYTYNSGITKEWDPNTLKYKETSGTASWTCETGADQITVTNNSNADITATLTYTQTETSITGTFTNSKIGLKSAEGTDAGAGPSETATLSLSGALADTATGNTEIGKVNVTISDYIGTQSKYNWDGNGSVGSGKFYKTLTDDVYIGEKTCSTEGFSTTLFYIYDDYSSNHYVIKDGTITSEGTYSLEKVSSGDGSYTIKLPNSMALAGKTIRFKLDLRNTNNPTLTIKVI